MKKLSIIFSASLLLYSCIPKSFCFFNAAEKTFYITETKNDSIRSVAISSENPQLNFKKTFELNPGVKTFKVTVDSIVNRKVLIFITTSNQIGYSLRLNESDWSTNKTF